jgi:hypothetical protein
MAADTYFSLNSAEMQMLRSATFEAIGLYLILKEKAAFKTGEVGMFHRQKLNYAWFAKEMDRPSSQGRSGQTFDSTDIKRLLAQLAGLGLVEDECWDGKRLSLRLPFSPLWKGNPAIQTGEARLPRGVQAKQPKSTVPPALPEDASSLSVMTSKRGSKPFFSSVITTDSGGFAADPLKEPAQPIAPPTAAPDPIEELAERFRGIVAREGGLMSDTPVSREYYAAWAKAGLTTDILEMTICLHKEPFRPGDLNHQLFPRKTSSEASGKQKQRAMQRARAAL